jgi:protein phosphatase-4 regulatory subunit 3
MQSDDDDLHLAKVYRLNNADAWEDLGTGACVASQGQISVVAIEDEEQGSTPGQVIIKTDIHASSCYSQQQDTLIVWTDPNGNEYALSFERVETCNVIW